VATNKNSLKKTLTSKLLTYFSHFTPFIPTSTNFQHRVKKFLLSLTLITLAHYTSGQQVLKVTQRVLFFDRSGKFPFTLPGSTANIPPPITLMMVNVKTLLLPFIMGLLF
jgi:hypothetical protein